MYELTRKLSKAYWPNPAKNESANREAGDTAVDGMTVGELARFFAECKAGPTYCMVKRRVQELLEEFPPHVERKSQRVAAAFQEAQRAFLELQTIAG